MKLLGHQVSRLWETRLAFSGTNKRFGLSRVSSALYNRMLTSFT